MKESIVKPIEKGTKAGGFTGLIVAAVCKYIEIKYEVDLPVETISVAVGTVVAAARAIANAWKHRTKK